MLEVMPFLVMLHAIGAPRWEGVAYVALAVASQLGVQWARARKARA